MPLPEEFLYQLKAANPIDTTMARYAQLHRTGSNYKCLCPFHSEKSPSCTVYTQTQSFYCFGCGAGGDVITFVSRIENIEPYEAIRLLAERAGLDLPDQRQEDRAVISRVKLLELNRETANFYYKNLLNGEDKRGLQYLVNRKLSPATIKKYGLGYAPAAWDALLRHLTALGYTEEQLIEAGLCKRGSKGGCFDFFRGRVMFPIIDLRGNVIAFGGRILDGEDGPKYLNSGDTPVFKKSRNLFSLQFAKNAPSKTLILAEGYMDVISINQAGFENVVATLGTALTDEQARLMRQYATDIILSYDSDAAGQAATQRAVNLLSAAGLHARILKIDGAKDPDEYIKRFGSVRFKQLLDNAGGAIHFQLERCKDGLDLQSEQGKVDYLKRTVSVLSQIENEMERDIYLTALAKEAEINAELLRAQVKAAVKKTNYKTKKKQWQAITAQPYFRDEVNPEAVALRREAKAEETILAYLFRNPDMLDEVKRRIPPAQFVTSFHRRLYTMLAEQLPNVSQFSVSLFSTECTQEEMGRITGITAKYDEIAPTEQSVDDCIRVLLQAQANEKRNPESLSDDDLIDLVNQARNQK